MKDNITFLAHGFRARDGGSSTVMKVATHIAPYSSISNYAYGYFNLFDVLFKNKKAAKRFAEIVISDHHGHKYAIGHSNGCAIIVEAMRQGAKFDTILLINPALNINTVFPEGDYKIVVIHTKHDKATKAARFFDSIPFVELFVPDEWGAMGTRGYQGTDQRVLNMDWSEILTGHSTIFTEEIMALVGPQLAFHLYPEA